VYVPAVDAAEGMVEVEEEEAKLKVVGAVGGVHKMRAAVRATVGAVVATSGVPWHLPSLVPWLLPSSPAPCGVADVLPASCAVETVADDVASGSLDVVACMPCGSATSIALAMPWCAASLMALGVCAPNAKGGACVVGVDCVYSVESDVVAASAAGVERDIAAAASVAVEMVHLSSNGVESAVAPLQLEMVHTS